MNSKKQRILVGIAITGIAITAVPTAFAGTVSLGATATIDSTIAETVTQTIDFGNIALSPSTSTVTIDASAGAATPATTLGGSVTTGGHSGEITVAAAMDLLIEVTYPNTADAVALVFDSVPIYVVDIAANSEGGGAANLITHTGGTDTLIDVGGAITFTGTEPEGTYIGNMSVTLNYN